MAKFFDEIFGDSFFEGDFVKRIQSMMNEIEMAVKNGELEGGWEVKQIDEPGRKGYVVKGRFTSDQPLDPFNPIEPFKPLDPWTRRPIPQKPLRIPRSELKEIREPLTDVFEEEKVVKIYIQLPGEEKDDIQLNVAEGNIEVKAKNFYKTIDIPTSNVDIEKASSKYKNGVLDVTIPKKEKIPEKEKRKIKIE